MDSRDVTKQINAVIRPLLKEHGFSAFTGRTGWRYKPNRIEIINFQSFNSYIAGNVGCTTHSFSINLGSAVPAHADYLERLKEELPRTQEYHADFRRQLHKTIQQRELSDPQVWFVDASGENLEEVIRDAAHVINREAWTWFDQWSDDPWVVETLKAQDESMEGTWGFGRLGSPKRFDLIGVLEFRIEQRNAGKAT